MSNSLDHRGLTLFKCPRIRRPEYWQFIKLVAPPGRTLPAGQTRWSTDDVTEAYCLQCKEAFSFRKGSSNSVRNHMQKLHPRELKNYLAMRETEEKAPATTEQAQRNGKRSSSESSGGEDISMEPSDNQGPAPKKGRTASKVRPEMSRREYYGDPTAMHLMIKWVCCSFQPLSVVTDASFDRLIQFLSQGKATVPDRTTMCRIVEQKAADLRFKTMVQVQKEVGHFSLSAEIWQTHYDSNWGGRFRYLALLCHHMNTNFESATLPLGVVYVPFPEDGGADALGEHLKAILREWQLPKNNLSLLLSNNDKISCHVASALEAKRFPDIWAVVHTSLLRWIWRPRDLGNPNATTAAPNAGTSVRSKQTAQSNVWGVIADLRALADALDYNWEVKQTLLRAQITGGDDESLKIRKTDCTSWEQVYDLLTELMVWRPSINRFFASLDTENDEEMAHNIPEPTAKMWFVAEALLLLLRTLREVQVITTSDKARTLPFMIHCLVISKHQLNQENVLDGLIKQYRLMYGFDATEISRDLVMLQKSVIESLRANFDDLLSEMMWCSLLDPRYAKMEHVGESERERCQLALVKETVDLFREDTPAQGLMRTLLQEETAPPLDDVRIEETRMCVADEVSAYLTKHQKREARITDPFKWWRDNRKRYPFLSKLARVWLGTVGCSSSAIGGLQRDIPHEVTVDNELHAETEDEHEAIINMLYLHVSLREPKDMELK
uniref:HAT C-terminal dimerisation domain-containing protein n=1 Tax=Phytophthora ramorum TaxID=164328 RepID=H3GHC0_PHYRM